MIKNYLRVALRNLLRYKLYTSISVIVLAIGLATSLLVMGVVSYEMSFEDFHVNRDRIYRVESTVSSPGKDEYISANVIPSIGRGLKEELPEAQQVAVFRTESITIVKVNGIKKKVVDEYANQGYVHHPTAIFANPDYLHTFSFPVKHGNIDTILSTPSSLLLTESAAKRYFPNQDPIGQVIEINETFNCTVAGILYDIPQNTQLYCDMMISYRTLENTSLQVNPEMSEGNDYVYVLLDKTSSLAGTTEKINTIASKYIDPESVQKFRFRLRKLKDVYFIGYQVSRGELNPRGEISLIFELSFIAFCILLLAIANYVNLATARAAERTREIGVRKVFGANRSSIVKQSIGESFLLTCLSTGIGLAVYEVFKLIYQGSFPRQMLVDFYSSPLMMSGVLILTVVVSVIAGFYPGFYLSRFRPVDVLYSKRGKKSARSLLRKGLVVFQFSIASMFVFAVIVMFRQADYLAASSTGFDPSNTIVFDFYGKNAVNECQRLRTELARKEFVTGTTTCNTPPGRNSAIINAFYKTENRRDQEMLFAKRVAVDYDYVNTFSIKIVKGRWFSQDLPLDISNSIVVNSRMADEVWGGDAIGQRLYRKNGFAEIIGVVDFTNGTSGISSDNHTVFKLAPDNGTCLAVKIVPGQSSEAISSISTIWKRILPETEFRYTFLDDEIAQSKGDLNGSRRMTLSLAFLAIFIACLGIFGLVSFSASQRTKEIGVRKVLGAPLINIISLLSREFIWLILIAGVIGCSFGYVLAQDILRGLTVRVPIGFGIPIMTILISLFSGVSIGGLQAWRAGRANPVESLKYE